MNQPSLIARIKSFFKPEGAQLEMMRYQPNSPSSLAGYLGLAFDAAAFSVFYSSTVISRQDNINIFGITSSGFWCGFDVLLNIVSLLFLFLGISQMKSYSRNWGIFAIAFGVFQFIRPFIYPLAIFNDGKILSGRFAFVVVAFILSGLFLIVAGFLSIYRGRALRAYLKTVKPIENEKMEVR